MNTSSLPNRLLPFALHFFRQFRWGCLGLLVFSVLGRAVFASIAYATKRLTDTVLSMRDPALEAGMLRGPFLLFVALVMARFVMDGGMWFSSYHTRSPMLSSRTRNASRVPILRTRFPERLRIAQCCYPTRCSRCST